MSALDDVDPWPPYPAPSEESEATSDSGFRMLRLERQLEDQRKQMEVYQQQHVSILNAITELTNKMSVSVQQNANTCKGTYPSDPSDPPSPIPSASATSVYTSSSYYSFSFISLFIPILTIRSDPPSDPPGSIRRTLSHSYIHPPVYIQ